MIIRLIALPFRIIGGIFSIILAVGKVVVGAGTGTVRFTLRHMLGAVIGALTGLFLGRKHLGVRLFTGRKKKARKMCKK